MSSRSKVLFVVALVLCFLMPSTQSLWIDEAQTWRFAVKPSMGALFAELWQTQTSEALMPLGMFVPRLAIHILGASEWGLRAVNILWAIAAAAAFLILGRRWRVPWAPLFLVVQPFVWFYANEARPYVLQIAAAAWLLVGFVACLEDRCLSRSSLLALIFSSAILIATTLFGVLTAGPVCLLVAWLAWRERWSLAKGWKIWTAVLLLWSALLGTYYVWTVARGASGARLWEVGLQNVAFALYEFLGFSGLGLSRNEIRELARNGGVGAILRSLPFFSTPAIAALAMAYAGVVLGFVQSLRRNDRRTLWAVGGVALLSGAGLAELAVLAHFPFWGRHLAPVFPFFCGLLILTLRDLGALHPRILKVFLPVFFALLALSSTSLRLAPWHAKDDYRAATAAARRVMNNGGIVWWCADVETARYYGLQATDEKEAHQPFFLVSGMPLEKLSASPVPSLIVISKPEIYDSLGSVRQYANQAGYLPQQRVNAFVILAIPPR